MMEKNSADHTLDPENVTTDELQDPMSGYTSADALSSESPPAEETHGANRLRDPMSGYTSADALQSGSHADPAGAADIHTEKTKDSMSGYASADALEEGQG